MFKVMIKNLFFKFFLLKITINQNHSKIFKIENRIPYLIKEIKQKIGM